MDFAVLERIGRRISHELGPKEEERGLEPELRIPIASPSPHRQIIPRVRRVVSDWPVAVEQVVGRGGLDRTAAHTPPPSSLL